MLRPEFRLRKEMNYPVRKITPHGREDLERKSDLDAEPNQKTK